MEESEARIVVNRHAGMAGTGGGPAGAIRRDVRFVFAFACVSVLSAYSCIWLCVEGDTTTKDGK